MSDIKIKISLADPQVKEVWESAVEAKREVASWPAWKRGEDVAVTAVVETPASGSASTTAIKK